MENKPASQVNLGGKEYLDPKIKIALNDELNRKYQESTNGSSQIPSYNDLEQRVKELEEENNRLSKALVDITNSALEKTDEYKMEIEKLKEENKTLMLRSQY